MSEELAQRGLTEHGLPFGPYEFYNIGSTTINTLKRFRIVPNKQYLKSGHKKPDALLVDRSNLKNPIVVAVIENKATEEFTTPAKKQKAIEQCVIDYCKPLGAKVGIVTDGIEYIWVNPQLAGDKYDIILREDGYPLHLPFVWGNDLEIEQTLQALTKVVLNLSETNSQLKKAELQNPSNLADRVWQTLWLASGENPDVCLTTFVEIFVFKYLSDLGVLQKNHAAIGISFYDTYKIDVDKCLIFYSEQVRPYIKELFPPSAKDGTSIINSTVFDPENKDHNPLFHKVLREFVEFGPLKNINPEFKSRLYEHFLKKSISQKNWGQYFTPRNIVKAIVEMSEIEKLGEGAKVHDPACGVGGFILEPILTKRQRDYIFDEDLHLLCKLEYTGHDRDKKTIILAKANMLIYLNELIRDNANASKEFAKIFNDTFTSMHTSILGSIAHTPKEKYDLIMTNPPFVMTGTSKIKEFIKESGQLRQYYVINAMGVEGLFLEKMIRSLKPGGKAFIIVPVGIMNRLADNKLRKFIKDECIIEAIISLPKNAFYTSLTKTYILAITKKPVKDLVQTEPIYTYLVVNTGETLDAHRFECENDLPEMVRLFKYFKADKENFESTSKQCKVWPIEHFDPDKHWSVDRWWTEEEKIALEIVAEKNLITLSEFTEKLKTEKHQMEEAILLLSEMDSEIPQPEFTVEIGLDNEQYFELFIGKRVLKKELREKPDGTIPVYSANVNQPFGKLSKSNISNFKHDCVLWGIDGNFEFNVISREISFATTDHCGCIRIIDQDIDADYLYYYLTWIRSVAGLDRELRSNLTNMKKIKIRFPVLVDSHGNPKVKEPNKTEEGVTKIYYLDIESQKQIADHYRSFERIKGEISERIERLVKLEIPPVDVGEDEAPSLP